MKTEICETKSYASKMSERTRFTKRPENAFLRQRSVEKVLLLKVTRVSRNGGLLPLPYMEVSLKCL